MAKVQHYRGLHTHLDHLYEAIKRDPMDDFRTILWNIQLLVFII